MSVETEVQLLILDQPPHTFSRPERDLNVLIRLVPYLKSSIWLPALISDMADPSRPMDCRGFTENVSFNVKVDKNFQVIRPYLLISLFDQRVHQL